MQGWMSKTKVLGKAREHAFDDVNTVLAECGAEAVIDTLKPGCSEWDAASVNAGVAQAMRIPEKLHSTYYREYARAARERAEEIRDEYEAEEIRVRIPGEL